MKHDSSTPTAPFSEATLPHANHAKGGYSRFCAACQLPPVRPHNSYLCGPHGEPNGCEILPDACEDKENTACNPYWLPGYCPTEGEGDVCGAEPDTPVRGAKV